MLNGAGDGSGPAADDADIFAGLTFADDWARQQAGGPRPVDVQPPDPNRGGDKWLCTDPRLPEDLATGLGGHRAAGRKALRTASRRGDAAACADAQRRIDLVARGSGAGRAQWWSRTVAEASIVAAEALAELDATWGTVTSARDRGD